MVLPWMENGCIRSYIRRLRERGELPDDRFVEFVNNWLYQVSLGLLYLHEEGIVHGDLHGGNILIDASGNALLTDFGTAQISDVIISTSTRGSGALRWRAPELIDPETFGLVSSQPTTASDVYAFAFICIELYTEELPFSDLEELQIALRVIQGKRPERPSVSGRSAMSDPVWDIVTSCWAQVAQDRPSSHQVAQRFNDILSPPLGAWSLSGPSELRAASAMARWHTLADQIIPDHGTTLTSSMKSSTKASARPKWWSWGKMLFRYIESSPKFERLPEPPFYSSQTLPLAAEDCISTPLPALEGCSPYLPFSPDSSPPLSTKDDDETISQLVSRVSNLLSEHNDRSPIDNADVQPLLNEAFRLLTYRVTHNYPLGLLLDLCIKVARQLATLPDVMLLEYVRYEVGSPIGRGSFADVFRGKYGSTYVAVKRFRQSAETKYRMESFYRAALLWKLLDHPNILPLLGVYRDSAQSEDLLIVLRLAENGTIQNYIGSLHRLGELTITGRDFVRAVNKWLYQISLALAYIHERGATHGDLHCGNILIDSKGDAQLSDFGLVLATTRFHNYTVDTSKHSRGALFTCAPELLDPKEFVNSVTRRTPECDVYAFAFVCIELYTGQRAFSGELEGQILNLVRKGARPSRPVALLPEGDPALDTMWGLITRCWSQDLRQRPTFQEVVGEMETVFRELESGPILG